MPGSVDPQLAYNEDLVREAHHRCSNDLQMVVALLTLNARDAASPEASALLIEAANRVGLLARARRSAMETTQATLASALRGVCEALRILADPRDIMVAFHSRSDCDGLSLGAVASLCLATNELATNAIKHGFPDGRTGKVNVTLGWEVPGTLSITVEDDGCALPPVTPGRPTLRADGSRGLGIDLARRLIAPYGATLVLPEHGAKRFEIRVDVPGQSTVN